MDGVRAVRSMRVRIACELLESDTHCWASTLRSRKVVPTVSHDTSVQVIMDCDVNTRKELQGRVRPCRVVRRRALVVLSGGATMSLMYAFHLVVLHDRTLTVNGRCFLLKRVAHVVVVTVGAPITQLPAA